MLAGMMDRLRVLEIPLEGGTHLMVPNVAVAEVIPAQPAEAVPLGPPWLEGMLEWRDHRIPLLRLEKLLGLPVETSARTRRIAVFNRSRKEGRPPFYALRLQGIPRLAKVTEDQVQDVTGEEDETGFMHFGVEVDGRRFVIPDLVVIEATIETGLKQAGLCGEEL